MVHPLKCHMCLHPRTVTNSSAKMDHIPFGWKASDCKAHRVEKHTEQHPLAESISVVLNNHRNPIYLEMLKLSATC